MQTALLFPSFSAPIRAVLLGGVALVACQPALAQQLNEPQTPISAPDAPMPASDDQIGFAADTLEYNSETEMVTASGNVQLLREGNRLRADKVGRELEPQDVKDAFYKYFANVSEPLHVIEYELDHQTEERGSVRCRAEVLLNGEKKKIEGLGNGPINAFVHALELDGKKDFVLTDYRSHSLHGGSSSDAAAYVQLKHNDGRLVWGAGVDPSIEMAGLRALVSAWNLLR